MRQLLSFLSRNKSFFVFMLGMLMFRSALADWNDVPTGSMQPTIQIGDRIWSIKPLTISAYPLPISRWFISLIPSAEISSCSIRTRPMRG